MANSEVQNRMASMTYFCQYTDSCLPDWLERREEVRSALQMKRDQLRFINGVIAEVPEDQKFDLVSPSNIFDMAPREKAASGVAEIANKYVAKDGLFLLRLCFGGARDIVESSGNLKFSSSFPMDTMRKIETGPFFHDTEDGVAVLSHQ